MTRIFTYCYLLGFSQKKYLGTQRLALSSWRSRRSVRLNNPQPPNNFNRKELSAASRNRAGARTFLSAAGWGGKRAGEILRASERSGFAADKNVRAPVPSEKSSPPASKLDYCSAKNAKENPGKISTRYLHKGGKPLMTLTRIMVKTT